MTSRDRIRAAIAGKPVDRVPVALWRHFPGDDQRAESLAAAHVTFQKTYQWDLLKVTPASGYYGDDWGLRAGYKPNREGTRHYTDRPIKNTAGWNSSPTGRPALPRRHWPPGQTGSSLPRRRPQPTTSAWRNTKSSAGRTIYGCWRRRGAPSCAFCTRMGCTSCSTC